MTKFGILGGGIIGLSTALALQEAYPDATIILKSAEDCTMTTGHGAPGVFYADPLWMPGFRCCQQSQWCTDCPFARWAHNSKSRYWSIAASSDSVRAGVFFQPTFEVFETEPGYIPFSGIVSGAWRKTEKDELLALGFNDVVNTGYTYVTCMIEGRYYMPYLISKLQEHSPEGFVMDVGESGLLNTLADVKDWALSEQLDVVINCTGLGSAILCEDRHLVPARGHLVRVAAPWMKFGFDGPNLTHAFAGKDSVILGGFEQHLPCTLDQPLTPDMHAISKPATTQILERIGKIWRGPLNKADILEEWTGFRPYRDIVRLELNWLNGKVGAHKVPIVHNYGHGGMGVTLSWGTALDVVYLVGQALKAGASSQTEVLYPEGLENLALK